MDGMGGKDNIMFNFDYVTKAEALPVKKELIKIVNEVQNLVREKFTFNFYFIGSSSRNMITCDFKSNIGFDFDINIEINDDDENYTPKEIKEILVNAFNKVVKKYGYDYCENSTRVITIKMKDYNYSKILHSCDFAIVFNCNDGRQQYIRFNKQTNNYSWEYQPNGFMGLYKKTEWLKENGYWQNLRDYYLSKKNTNKVKEKHSRSLYAEAINELYQKLN